LPKSVLEKKEFEVASLHTTPPGFKGSRGKLVIHEPPLFLLVRRISFVGLEVRNGYRLASTVCRSARVFNFQKTINDRRVSTDVTPFEMAKRYPGYINGHSILPLLCHLFCLLTADCPHLLLTADC
jgi:hypothetical protein